MLTFIAQAVPLGPSDDVFFTRTVIAGVIAALASLLGLVISKESKVSEFRQKWIDELRKDIAAALSLAGEYAGNRLLGQSSGSTEKINQKVALIRLRLNLEEEDHEALFQSIKSLKEQAVNLPPAPNSAVLLASQHAFGVAVADSADIAAKVLKREWNVVKSGERVYKIMFFVAVLAIPALLYTAIVHYLHHTIFLKHY